MIITPELIDRIGVLGKELREKLNIPKEIGIMVYDKTVVGEKMLIDLMQRIVALHNKGFTNFSVEGVDKP